MTTELKAYNAAANALRAAEVALEKATKHRDDVLGQITVARQEVAQVQRESDQSTSAESVNVSAIRELSQRRAIAEDVAAQLDLIATAAKRRMGEAKVAIFRAEREAQKAASAFYAASLEAVYQDFWKANRDRFAKLVSAAHLADKFEGVANGQGWNTWARASLAQMFQTDLPAVMERYAAADPTFDPPLAITERGHPPATDHRSAALADVDRNGIRFDGVGNLEADLVALGEPPAPPDPLGGWSRDPRQVMHQLQDHNRQALDLCETQKRLEARIVAARIESPPRVPALMRELQIATDQLEQIEARLSRWSENLDLLQQHQQAA